MKRLLFILVIGSSVMSCAKESLSVEAPVQQKSILEEAFSNTLSQGKRFKLVDCWTKDKSILYDIAPYASDDYCKFYSGGRSVVETERSHAYVGEEPLKEFKWSIHTDADGLKMDWIDEEYVLRTFYVNDFTDSSFVISILVPPDDFKATEYKMRENHY